MLGAGGRGRLTCLRKEQTGEELEAGPWAHLSLLEPRTPCTNCGHAQDCLECGYDFIVTPLADPLAARPEPSVGRVGAALPPPFPRSDMLLSSGQWSGQVRGLGPRAAWFCVGVKLGVLRGRVAGVAASGEIGRGLWVPWAASACRTMGSSLPHCGLPVDQLPPPPTTPW